MSFSGQHPLVPIFWSTSSGRASLKVKFCGKNEREPVCQSFCLCCHLTQKRLASPITRKVIPVHFTAVHVFPPTPACYSQVIKAEGQSWALILMAFLDPFCCWQRM